MGRHRRRLLPPTTSAFLGRPRLVHRLLVGVQYPVTAVVAPAGSGKTVLIRQWAASAPPGMVVAWVALDPRDRDRGLFWDAVLEALREATGVPADHLLATLRPGPGIDEALLDSVVDALDALDQPVVLVLDDVHVLEDALPGPDGRAPAPVSVWDDLDVVLRSTSALRLLTVGQSPPGLPLPRLRAAGELNEVTAGDLAFTRPELLRVLEAEGMAVAGPVVDELLERTRGWAVAVRLAALHLRDQLQAVQALGELGTAGPLADYLLDELLGALGVEVQEFLICTSVVDVVDEQLAAALETSSPAGGPTEEGARTAGARLQRLAAAGALVERLGPLSRSPLEPTPDVLPRYSYHPLLRDLLRATLAQRPALHRELHRRSALHLEAAGSWLDALDHALSAGDDELVLDMAMRSAAAHFASHRRPVLLELLERLPDRSASTDPAVSTLLAAAAYCRYDVAGLVRHAAEADRLLSGPAGAAMGELRRGTTLVVLRVLQAAVAVLITGPDQMLAAARAAARQLHALPPSQVPAWAEYDDVAECLTGTAEVWTGALASGVSRLRTRHRTAQTTPLVGVHAAGVRALGLVLLGRAAEAQIVAEDVLDRARGYGWDHSSLCAPAWTASALAAVERADPAAVAPALESARATAAVGAPDQLVRTGIELAQTQLLLLTGRATGALGALRDADAVLRGESGKGVLRSWVGYVGAHVHLALGDPDAALARLAQAHCGPHGAVPQPFGDRLAVMVVRCQLAAGRSDEALAALPDRLACGPDLLDELTWVDADLCAALLAAALDGRDAFAGRGQARLPESLLPARQSLAAALGRAARHGLVRPLALALAVPALPDLLRQCSSDGLPEPAAQLALDLLSQVTRRPVPARHRDVRLPGSISGLTGRELDVLELVPTALTAQDIGARLHVTSHTARQHLKSIYRKLGVESRGAAAARAAELGLIALPQALRPPAS